MPKDRPNISSARIEARDCLFLLVGGAFFVAVVMVTPGLLEALG